MSLIAHENILGEKVIYQDQVPCIVMGFQETKIKEFPTVYALLINVCTGEVIKAELGSLQFLVAKEAAGYDRAYYQKCIDHTIMRTMFGTKIANTLIHAGYGSMKDIEMNFSKLTELKGIGDSSVATIARQIKIWREGGVVNETEENI